MADTLPEDRIVWRDPIGLTDFADPLNNQDTFVNSLYLKARYFRIRNLNVEGKLKYEHFNQLGAQASLKRDRSFLGLINKADYAIRPSDRLALYPKWKSMYQRETPTALVGLKANQLTESFFFIGQYSLLPKTNLDFGVEFSLFENLAERPAEASPSYVEDFRSLVFSALLTNVSSYQGYELTMNAGFLLERQFFAEQDPEAIDRLRPHLRCHRRGIVLATPSGRSLHAQGPDPRLPVHVFRGRGRLVWGLLSARLVHDARDQHGRRFVLAVFPRWLGQSAAQAGPSASWAEPRRVAAHLHNDGHGLASAGVFCRPLHRHDPHPLLLCHAGKRLAHPHPTPHSGLVGAARP